MKVTIEEIPKTKEPEIVIRCHEMDDEILAVLNKLKATEKQVIGVCDNELHRISLKDIYYFETVDQKSFLYCEDRVFETKMKLYEFEETVLGSKFFRASKSVVINTMKISYVKPSLSGRFEAVLENQEKLLVSRQYVPELKRQLGL